MRLVDADELLEILRIMQEVYFDRKIILGKVVEEVKRMPTVEPVRKGKWVDGRCNQCGYHALYWPMASTYTESKYCPCCGAKMEEPEDIPIEYFESGGR